MLERGSDGICLSKSYFGKTYVSNNSVDAMIWIPKSIIQKILLSLFDAGPPFVAARSVVNLVVVPC